MGFFKRDGKTRPISPKKIRDTSDDDVIIENNITLESADELDDFAREKAGDFEAEHNLGERVRMTDDALENYGEKYRGKIFTVSHIAKNREEHSGYDEGVGKQALYDLKLNGKDFGSSLYDWELESA